MSHISLKTRFCPSPTGYVHLGNIRTALFNYLFAHAAQDGSFLLRIEDTDRERSEHKYVEQLYHDMQWLGLQWDEGPEQDQGRGPYFQSERQDLYDQYYARLEKDGKAYPCFCSEEELALSRKVQRSMGKPPRYAGTCHGLSAAQIEEKRAAGLQPTLRFHVPEDEVIEFEDLVHGQQRFLGKDIGDFIIRRANGTSPFMFCNAIDDALMGVTHVMRGEDHLTNTPRQLLIYQSLELTAPTYAHISLIVGKDGSPLSKRHGSRSIFELRDMGYLPQAITNYLARLGHHYADESFKSLAQLAQEFKVASLNKSPAKYDPEQLNYWQKQALESLDKAQWLSWAGDSVNEVPAALKPLFVETIRPNVRFPEEVAQWLHLLYDSSWQCPESLQDIITQAGPTYFNAVVTQLKEHGKDYAAVVAGLKNELGLKGKALFQPLRVALTGMLHGPEMKPLFELMDLELIQKRMEHAALC